MPRLFLLSLLAAASAHAQDLKVRFLAERALPEISRARAQLLIEHGQVRVSGSPAKAKYKLNGNEHVVVEGEPQPAPLRATAEDRGAVPGNPQSPQR